MAQTSLWFDLPWEIKSMILAEVLDEVKDFNYGCGKHIPRDELGLTRVSHHFLPAHEIYQFAAQHCVWDIRHISRNVSIQATPQCNASTSGRRAVMPRIQVLIPPPLQALQNITHLRIAVGEDMGRTDSLPDHSQIAEALPRLQQLSIDGYYNSRKSFIRKIPSVSAFRELIPGSAWRGNGAGYPLATGLPEFLIDCVAPDAHIFLNRLGFASYMRAVQFCPDRIHAAIRDFLAGMRCIKPSLGLHIFCEFLCLKESTCGEWLGLAHLDLARKELILDIGGERIVFPEGFNNAHRGSYRWP